MSEETNSFTMRVKTELIVALELKELYLFTAKHRRSIDRSECADVSSSKYQFEMGSANRIYGADGRVNLAHFKA